MYDSLVYALLLSKNSLKNMNLPARLGELQKCLAVAFIFGRKIIKKGVLV